MFFFLFFLLSCINHITSTFLHSECPKSRQYHSKSIDIQTSGRSIQTSLHLKLSKHFCTNFGTGINRSRGFPLTVPYVRFLMYRDNFGHNDCNSTNKRLKIPQANNNTIRQYNDFHQALNLRYLHSPQKHSIKFVVAELHEDTSCRNGWKAIGLLEMVVSVRVGILGKFQKNIYVHFKVCRCSFLG